MEAEIKETALESASGAKADLLSMTPAELRAFMETVGEKPFRAGQVFRWLHQRLATDFNEMTDLSKALRAKLTDRAYITVAETVLEQRSQRDETIKYLFCLKNHTIIAKSESSPQDVTIESVWMRYAFGHSVCLSTQAGCRMGCSFCASALHGLERSLTAGEIVAQAYAMQRAQGRRVDNVVLMGSGEPLDNYENTVKAIRLLQAEDGLHIGGRHITLSTCGLADGIERLKEEGLQITLAVSLHAPNDDIRILTMPVARRYPMAALLAVCRAYAERTKRRVTYEYALIRGLNDRPEHAAELAAKLKGTLCHVNLIPVNEIQERSYRSSRNAAAFAEVLQKHGVETTVRRTLGADIDAACGQLRNRNICEGDGNIF